MMTADGSQVVKSLKYMVQVWPLVVTSTEMWCYFGCNATTVFVLPMSRRPY